LGRPPPQQRRFVRPQCLSDLLSRERVLTVARTFELAQKAQRILYTLRETIRKEATAENCALNCAIAGVNLWPTYTKPFEQNLQRAKK
jgi:hypothetical protein